MTKRLMSTVTAVVLVIAALVFTGTMTATATNTGGDHCTTEYSGWVRESPGEGWIKIHTRTVVDKEAYDEKVKDAYDETVAGKWWNFSPTNSHAPFVGPPSFPSDARGKWNGPHTNGGPKGTGTYAVGNPAKGGNWFHRDADTVIHHDAEYVHHDAEYVHHDAVTHQEFKFKKVTCPPPDGEPTPVQFSAFSEPTPPTCDEPGSFSQIAVPGVRFSVTPEYDGPGTYTITATLDNPDAFTFPDGTTAPKSTTVTVLGATGVTQSSNPEAPCYLAPGDTPDEPGTPPGDTPDGDTPDGDTPATGTNIPTTSSGAPATPAGSVPSSIDAGQ